jgi:hypothetical protein
MREAKSQSRVSTVNVGPEMASLLIGSLLPRSVCANPCWAVQVC